MTLFDTDSPAFSVKVITNTREIQLAGRTDPRRLGQLIAEGRVDATARVETFEFEDAEEEQDVLRLTVDNSDHYFFEHPAWIKGNLVRFMFGYPGRVFGPRTHVVDDVKGFLTLTITCIEEAALSNVAGGRLFKNMSRGDVVRKLVAEGRFPGVFGYAIEDSALVAEGKRDWQQARQTDWQFIQRLAEKVGFVVYVEGPTLHFHRRKLADPPRRSFDYFYGEGDLKDFQIDEWKTTDRSAEVVVKGRDPLERKNLEATGSDSTTTRPTLGKQNTLVLRRGAAGGLVESQVAGKRVVPSPEESQATITAEADTQFRAQEEDEIKATATIIGDPWLPAKTVIEINGLSPELSGKYYVTKHVHKIDREGYVGTMSLIKNALGSLPTSDPPTLDSARAEENVEEVPRDPRAALMVDPDTGALIQKPVR